MTFKGVAGDDSVHFVGRNSDTRLCGGFGARKQEITDGKDAYETKTNKDEIDSDSQKALVALGFLGVANAAVGIRFIRNYALFGWIRLCGYAVRLHSSSEKSVGCIRLLKYLLVAFVF